MAASNSSTRESRKGHDQSEFFMRPYIMGGTLSRSVVVSPSPLYHLFRDDMPRPIVDASAHLSAPRPPGKCRWSVLGDTFSRSAQVICAGAA